jgi:hypothetical protein
MQQQARCSHCKEVGHNIHTCQKDAEITVDLFQFMIIESG